MPICHFSLSGFFGEAQLSSLFTGDAEVIAQSAVYLRGFSADFPDTGGTGNTDYDAIWDCILCHLLYVDEAGRTQFQLEEGPEERPEERNHFPI